MTRDEILDRLRERIVGFAASRMQRDAAEDIAQEVLVVLHEKYRHLERMEDLVPVAFEILRFKAIALRRKTVRRGEYNQVSVEDIHLPDPGVDPAMEAERRELRQRLIEAITKLGTRCRRIMALKLEGKNFIEIQKILGAASINTVYTWDLRCRKQLLELMGGSWDAKSPDVKT
jgi:RNA polymerase sigma-70 factor (ECF subfamily)